MHCGMSMTLPSIRNVSTCKLSTAFCRYGDYTMQSRIITALWFDLSPTQLSGHTPTDLLMLQSSSPAAVPQGRLMHTLSHYLDSFRASATRPQNEKILIPKTMFDSRGTAFNPKTFALCKLKLQGRSMPALVNY